VPGVRPRARWTAASKYLGPRTALFKNIMGTWARSSRRARAEGQPALSTRPPAGCAHSEVASARFGSRDYVGGLSRGKASAPPAGPGNDALTRSSLSSEGRRSFWRRLGRRRWLVLVGGLGLVVVLVASSVLFVWPATNQPGHVDAILSMNGENESARENTAITLAEKGYAPVLIFSQGHDATACPHVPGVKVVCFIPVPNRTVGEVRFATAYAKEHDLHSLLIVPGRAQTTRARILMKRCFSGEVLMLPAPVPLLAVPFEVVYEWGALAKALLVDRSC
jgi:hypothetical protein